MDIASPESYISKQISSLGLPENLAGKKVLEAFAGNPMHWERDWVVDHGGAYTSLDINNWSAPAGTRVRANAWKMPFADHTFDYIIMSSPIIWPKNGAGTMLKEEAFTLFVECIRVLGEQPGNKVSVNAGIPKSEIERLQVSLGDLVKGFSDTYEIRVVPNGKAPYTFIAPENRKYAMQIIRK